VTDVRPPGSPACARPPDDDACLDWLWRRRYSRNGHDAECPQCERSRRFHRIRSRRSYACDHCGFQYFPTADTPFGRSSTPLGTWIAIAHLLMMEAGDVSAREIQRRFRLEYRTALRVKTRLRQALADDDEAGLVTDAVRDLSGRSRARQTSARTDPRTRARANKVRAAAARVFARRGFEHTRVADVAAECGASSAFIRHHFGTKDDLLHAAMLWTQEQGALRLRDLMRRERSPRGRLEALLEIALPSTDDIRDEYLLWLDAWARSRGGRRFDEDAIFSGWHEAVVAVAREGAAEGVFRLALPPEDFGDAFVAFVDGLSFKVVERYEEMPIERARQLLRQWVDDQLGLESPLAGSPT
jgi:AcrR family transcriptional regulator/transposase-like protein